MGERQVIIKGKPPQPEELVFGFMGEMLKVDYELGQQFRLNFKPTPKQQEVYDVLDNSSVPSGKWIHCKLEGGTGSGKTTCAVAYILDILLTYPGARALGVRRTMKDIRSTVWVEITEFLEKWGLKYEQNLTMGIIRLENGSEFWVRSDMAVTQSDRDKSDALGSTSFSAALLEEADSISKELARTLSGRMRQNVGVKRKVIFYLCNPPNKLHWLHKLFNKKKHLLKDRLESRFIQFRMNPEDNAMHVGTDYIEGIEEDWEDDEAFLRRNRYGIAGADSKGPPIFGKKVFSPRIHVAPKPICENWNPAYPILRGWDFGFNRSGVVFAQDDKDLHQLRLFRGFVKEYMTTEALAKEMLHLSHELFPDAEFRDFCDPRGKQKGSRSELSDVDILRAIGINPRWVWSNISYGVSIMSEQFRTIHGDHPAVLIDPSCDILIEGFELGYCNNVDTPHNVIDPADDDYYEHVIDAARYIFVNIRRPGQLHQTMLDRGKRRGWVSVMNDQEAQAFANHQGNIQLDLRNKKSGPGYGPDNTVASYSFGRRRRF